ncbi:MAG: hypothetical protein JWP76_1976 [Dactylosporangium sp.]|nr:hypothetical protein [Dactylosporangium sp.]
MIPLHIRKQSRHAAPSRLPRVAIVSTGFLAAAATAGIMLSQIDGPQVANASSTITASNLGRANDSVASQTQVRTAVQAAPPTQAQAPTPKAPTKAPAQAPTPKAPTQAPTPSPPTPSAPPSKVLDYTFQLQTTYYYCGPAATRIALTASGHTLSQDELARQLHTTTSGTDSANDTTRVLNNVIGRNAYQTREIPGPSATPAQMDQLQADVVRTINDGRVIVANIVHSVTDTVGVRHTYDGGHFLTIAGYKDDGRTVKVADNANPNGDGTYWVTTIDMANWMATHGYSY